jgi:hypothetical protein
MSIIPENITVKELYSILQYIRMKNDTHIDDVSAASHIQSWIYKFDQNMTYSNIILCDNKEKEENRFLDKKECIGWLCSNHECLKTLYCQYMYKQENNHDEKDD